MNKAVSHRKSVLSIKVKLSLAALIGSSTFFSTYSSAAVELSSALTYLDNPALANDSNANDSDVLVNNSLLVDFERETQVFQTTLNYLLNFEHYINGTFDDRDQLSGAGSIVWNISPDFLTWGISNIRNIEKIDFAQPNTPDNQNTVSITSTGPEVEFLIGAENRVTFGLDYALADYGDSVIGDQIRQAATAQISRNISDDLLMSINGSYLDVEFEESESFNYIRSSASVSAELAFFDFDFTADVGETEVERESTGSRSDPSFNFTATYTPNTTSQLIFSYSESVEDLFSLLIESNAVAGGDRITNANDDLIGIGGLNSFDFFLINQRELSYTYTTPAQSSLRVSYRYDNRVTDETNVEETIEMINANVRYVYSAKVNFDFLINYAELHGALSGDLQKQLLFGVITEYEINNRFSADFSLSRTSQKATQDSFDYDSWELMIGVVYTLQQ